MEPDHFEADSTFGDSTGSIASTTTSIKSAITKYEFENGRRYHAYKSGQYLIPNDEKEQERMDIEHQNQLLQLGALHLSPMKTPQRILDLGTGTGIWAISMADIYPSAIVLGTDLSAVQPTWVPPNVKFEVDDFEEEWTFGLNVFDMVHGRFLACSVSDYDRLYAQAFKALKPGGWLELSELVMEMYCDDGTLDTENSASAIWGKGLTEACAKIGRRIPRLEEYRKFLERAGFVDINEMILHRPTNDWPKDKRLKMIGKFCCLNFLEGMEAFTIGPFTRVLGWTPEKCQLLLVELRDEWTRRSMHGYHKGIAIWARKPEAKQDALAEHTPTESEVPPEVLPRV